MLVRVLGTLQVVIDDGCVVDAPRRVRSVLAALAIDPGRTVPVDVLLDVVWGARPPAGASETLRRHVARARGVVGERLERRRGGYALRVDRADVDGLALIDAVASFPGDDRVAGLRALEGLLTVWRGLPLPEVSDWLPGRAVAIAATQARLAALEIVLRDRIEGGRSAHAITEIEARVAEYPFHEPLWELLIIALQTAGRHAEALRAYERVRAVLADELGAVPGRGLRGAIDAVFRDDVTPVSRPSPLRLMPAVLRAARTASPQLVGRDGAVRELLTGLVTERGKPGGIAIVAGEAGIGKTRLVAEVAWRAVENGWWVLYGRFDRDLAIGLHPLGRLLSELAASGAPPPVSVLSSVLPLVPALAGSSGLPVDGAPVDLAAMLDAVVRWLGDASRRGPLLIVLDDGHRADPAVTAALVAIRDGLVDHRVSFVVTTRSWETGLATRLAMAVPPVLIVEPDRLSIDDIAVLAGGNRVLAEQVFERTGGNALLVEGVLRRFLQSGDLALDRLGEVTLRQQVRELGDATAEVLSIAALMLDGIDARVLAAALGMNDVALVTQLERATRSGVLAELAPYSWRFAHDLMRDAAHADRGPTADARAHERLGLAYERLQPDAIGSLAHHFDRAGAVHAASAARYLTAVAEARLRVFDGAGARTLFERALNRLDDTRTNNERLRGAALAGLAAASAQMGDRTWRDNALRAAAIAQECGDHDTFVRALLTKPRTGASGFRRADPERIRLLESAVATCSNESPRQTALLLGALADALPTTELAQREDLARRAVDAASAPGVSGRVHAAQLLGLLEVLNQPGRLTERQTILRRLDAVVRDTGDPRLRFHTAYLGFFIDGTAGRRSALDRRIDDLVAGADLAGVAHAAWLGAMCTATLRQCEGRLDDAERYATKALELALATNQPDAWNVYGSQLFHVRLYQGRLDELTSAANQSAADTAPTDLYRRSLRAVTTTLLGDPDRIADDVEALRHAGFATVPRDAMWTSTVTNYAVAAQGCRDHAAMTEILALLAPHARQFNCTGPTIEGPVGRVCGQLAGALGRWDEADRWFDGAVAACRRLRAPLLGATAEGSRAAMLMRKAGVTGERTDKHRARQLARRLARLGNERRWPFVSTTALALLDE